MGFVRGLFSVAFVVSRNISRRNYSISSYVANPVLCVTHNGQFFQIFGADTNVDGSFFDVVWYDLSVTKSTALPT